MSRFILIKTESEALVKEFLAQMGHMKEFDAREITTDESQARAEAIYNEVYDWVVSLIDGYSLEAKPRDVAEAFFNELLTLMGSIHKTLK